MEVFLGLFGFWCFLAWIVNTFVCAGIGAQKGEPVMGFFAGLFFGPLALAWLFFLNDNEEQKHQCPICFTNIQEPAWICPGCHSHLQWVLDKYKKPHPIPEIKASEIQKKSPKDNQTYEILEK